MPKIQDRDLVHLENTLYLPMVIKVLEKDIERINELPFKFNRPYLKIVEDALKKVKQDLKAAEVYLTRNHMRMERVEFNHEYSIYMYGSGGIEERHRILNKQIKLKCEEIIHSYFKQ